MSCRCLTKVASKMDTEDPKVYVAVGNDLQDGYRTLDWTLRKWKAQSISIVILHVTYNISIKDFVDTPCTFHTQLFLLHLIISSHDFFLILYFSFAYVFFSLFSWQASCNFFERCEAWNLEEVWTRKDWQSALQVHGLLWQGC